MKKIILVLLMGILVLSNFNGCAFLVADALLSEDETTTVDDPETKPNDSDNINNENNETTEPTTEEITTEKPTENIYDKEILFMNTAWGTSYSNFKDKHGELGIWALYGELYKTYSVDEIVLNDYQGLDFEYTDINIIGCCSNGEVEVAGYKTRDVNLYFSYVPVNGILTKKESDSALYGARYEFDTTNLKAMYSDLTTKLSSIYGEPNKTTTDADMWGMVYTYTYWYGQNDTMVVLKGTNAENDSIGIYKDEIFISYVWGNGDNLLQTASDTLKKQAKDKENSIYGDNSTNGL